MLGRFARTGGRKHNLRRAASSKKLVFLPPGRCPLGARSPFPARLAEESPLIAPICASPEGPGTEGLGENVDATRSPHCPRHLCCGVHEASAASGTWLPSRQPGFSFVWSPA